jgi:CBS-domain-containing membrane protein
MRFDRFFGLPARGAYILVCSFSALLTIAGLAVIGEWTGTTLLMAPLGASAVLLFSAPESPLARVRNQVGGHIVAALIGLIAISLPFQSLYLAAGAVALTVFMMMLLSVEHPPAGAVPLVMVLGDVQPEFLLGPVLFGTLFLGFATSLFHLLVSQAPSTSRDKVS